MGDGSRAERFFTARHTPIPELPVYATGQQIHIAGSSGQVELPPARFTEPLQKFSGILAGEVPCLVCELR